MRQLQGTKIRGLNPWSGLISNREKMSNETNLTGREVALDGSPSIAPGQSLQPLRDSHDFAVKDYFLLRQLDANCPPRVWSLAACDNALTDTKPDTWFTVTQTGSIATVYIVDNIGCYDQTADMLIAQVRDAQEIHLYINSRGGDGDGSLKLYNAIYGRVTLAQIQGNCFSSALTLAMAAKHIRIEAGARMMLHQPCMFRFGNSARLRQSADYLDRITADIIGAVVKRTGLPLSSVQAWFCDSVDTYFDAAEAVKNKLADEVFTLAQPLPAGVDAAPDTTTEQEREFFRMLRRFDTLAVGDKKRFFDGLGRWVFYHVTE